MTVPVNVAGSRICLSVSASLCTPKNSTRTFSERNAHTLLMLQLVSSELTTSEFASSVQSTSRSFEVRLAVMRSSWVIGTPVRVSLPVQVAKRTLAVPRDAIVLRADGVYVFRIVDGDLAERVIVETGSGADDLIEVLGELAVGDLVVVRGAEMLRDGQKVSQTSG